MVELKKNNIDTRLFFKGMNKQPALEKYGCNMSGEYPITDRLSENGFYLPSGSNLSEETIRSICQVIINFAKN